MLLKLVCAGSSLPKWGQESMSEAVIIIHHIGSLGTSVPTPSQQSGAWHAVSAPPASYLPSGLTPHCAWSLSPHCTEAAIRGLRQGALPI